jgi:hypothetical protein
LLIINKLGFCPNWHQSHASIEGAEILDRKKHFRFSAFFGADLKKTAPKKIKT